PKPGNVAITCESDRMILERDHDRISLSLKPIASGGSFVGKLSIAIPAENWQTTMPVIANVSREIEVAPSVLFIPKEGKRAEYKIIAWRPDGKELGRLSDSSLPR